MSSRGIYTIPESVSAPELSGRTTAPGITPERTDQHDAHQQSSGAGHQIQQERAPSPYDDPPLTPGRRRYNNPSNTIPPTHMMPPHDPYTTSGYLQNPNFPIIVPSPYTPGPISPYGYPQPTIVILQPSDMSSSSGELGSGVLPLPVSSSSSRSSSSTTRKLNRSVIHFLTDTVPRQVYQNLLLHIPSLYHSRVTRVFEDAELSMPVIQEKVADAEHTEYYPGTQWSNYVPPYDSSTPPPPTARFRRSWEDFVGSLMSEWQSQNLISVLLLSAVLTMLQIQGVGSDPIMRTAALLSLVCALMSLLYGCIYMARFGTMNKMSRAASWADEAKKTRKRIFWNVWVFLAMPAVWLAWSIISFIVCVLSFIWRTGSTLDAVDSTPLTPHQALGPRIAITGVFAIGLLYFILIMKTLRRYGSEMDREWKEKTSVWRSEKTSESKIGLPTPLVYQPDQEIPFVPGPYRMAIHDYNYITPPPVIAITGEYPTWFETMKIVDMSLPLEDRRPPRPDVLGSGLNYISDEIWWLFIHDINLAWSGEFAVPTLTPEACQDLRSLIVADLVDTWNTGVFLIRGMEIYMSSEAGPDTNVNGEASPLTPPSVLYLSCARHGATSGGWKFPYVRPPPPDPEESEADSIIRGDPYGSSSQQFRHRNKVPYVPGPYRRTLQYSRTTRFAFTDRNDSSSYDQNENWEDFIEDLRSAWNGDIPVPNLTPSARLEMRSLIIADLLDTWNTEYFLNHGHEVVLSPGANPTTVEMGPWGQTIFNDRGYYPSPLEISVNPMLLDPPLDVSNVETSRVQNTKTSKFADTSGSVNFSPPQPREVRTDIQEWVARRRVNFEDDLGVRNEESVIATPREGGNWGTGEGVE